MRLLVYLKKIQGIMPLDEWAHRRSAEIQNNPKLGDLMAMLMSTSTLAYSTTTGRRTPSQKHTDAVSAIAKMHLAAGELTRGELRAEEAAEAEYRQNLCEMDDLDGAVCGGTLLRGICVNSSNHLA